MTCAQVGLEPNTVLGHAYLIPFKNGRKSKEAGRDVYEVQVVIGYKGFIDLARRSGHITSIDAGIHYSDDELWDYERGTEARLRHIPGMLEGEKLHAFAIAKFKDGGHAFVVLPWKQVMRVRDGSQGYQRAKRDAEKYGKPLDTPWTTHEDAMAAKTAIRALVKFLPLSVEFQQAIAIDERERDYRGFAIDPMGDTPGLGSDDDDDGRTIEATATETEAGGEPEQSGQPAEEEKPAAATPTEEKKPDPKAAADAAKEKARAAAGKAPEKTKRDLLVDAPREPAGRWLQIVADIRNNILDLSPGRAGEALDIYDIEELELFKTQEPDLFAEVMAEITARENEAD
jgi:recombination protein RecT